MTGRTALGSPMVAAALDALVEEGQKGEEGPDEVVNVASQSMFSSRQSMLSSHCSKASIGLLRGSPGPSSAATRQRQRTIWRAAG